ncbi:hypothetical protein CDEF62S_01959 [Castellaniella defragrans]
MKLNAPSDCLFLAYALFVLLTGAVTWGASGLLDYEGAVTLLAFVFGSLVLTKFFITVFRACLLKYVPLVRAMSDTTLVLLVLSLLLLGVAAGIWSGQAGSFSLQDSYVRRIVGREHFPAGALRSYIFSIALNGAMPFAALLASIRRNVWVFPLLVAFATYAYWLLGTKEPVFLCLVMGYLGYRLRMYTVSRVSLELTAFVTIIFLVALIEYQVWDYSYISDYFIRRAFAVVGQIQGAFVGYLGQHGGTFNFLEGAHPSLGGSASMLVGKAGIPGRHYQCQYEHVPLHNPPERAEGGTWS